MAFCQLLNSLLITVYQTAVDLHAIVVDQWRHGKFHHRITVKIRAKFFLAFINF